MIKKFDEFIDESTVLFTVNSRVAEKEVNSELNKHEDDPRKEWEAAINGKGEIPKILKKHGLSIGMQVSKNVGPDVRDLMHNRTVVGSIEFEDDLEMSNGYINIKIKDSNEW
jgi:hypothetical protein